MIYRLIIFLVCTVAFINGCNSVISNFAGTHKLRQYSLSEIANTGIGDADYIEITDATVSEEFTHVPGDKSFRRDLLVFPVVPNTESTGNKLHVIGWVKKFDLGCVGQNNCNQIIKHPLKGLISDIKRVKGNINHLQQRYEFEENEIVYIELGRSPFPWYWSMLIMITAVLIIIVMEKQRLKKQQTN